jgi:rubrerythrin
MVREDQYEKAKELIAELDINFAAMAPGRNKGDKNTEEKEWECTDCGATVSPDATVCPKCGADVSEIED